MSKISYKTIGKLIIYIVSIIMLYVLLTLFIGKTISLEDRIFICMLIMIFIPSIYLFLFLYIKLLKFFHVNINGKNVFAAISFNSRGVLFSNIFKSRKNKLSFIYNIFGDLIINIFYVFSMLLIFSLSFFITYLITFLVIKPTLGF